MALKNPSILLPSSPIMSSNNGWSRLVHVVWPLYSFSAKSNAAIWGGMRNTSFLDMVPWADIIKNFTGILPSFTVLIIFIISSVERNRISIRFRFRIICSSRSSWSRSSSSRLSRSRSRWPRSGIFSSFREASICLGLILECPERDLTVRDRLLLWFLREACPIPAILKIMNQQ